MTVNKMVECCYANYHLYQVSRVLNVLNHPFTPSVILPNVIMLSVVAPLAS
jgi:hypothetical protein